MSAKFAALAKRKDEQNALASFAEFFGKKMKSETNFLTAKSTSCFCLKKGVKKGNI